MAVTHESIRPGDVVVLQFNIMLTPEQVDEVRRRFRWGKSEGVGGQQPS